MKNWFCIALVALFSMACGTSDHGPYTDTSSDTDSDSDTDTDTDSDTDTDADTDSDGDLDFVTIWKTNNSGASEIYNITLPIVVGGDYDFTVDWGDGTQDDITSFENAAKTHTYEVPGTYEVRISGLIVGWSFQDMWNTEADGGVSDDRDMESKLLEVKNWGPLSFGNTSGQFKDCTALEITATDVPNLEGTTDLSNAFQSCVSLTAIPSITAWDTSNVTDMS